MKERKIGHDTAVNMKNGSGKMLQTTGIILLAFLALAIFAIWPPNADARSSYWSTYCSGCHNATATGGNATAACNGCHHHGANGMSASTNKTTYAPGESVTVTFDGGSQSGWIRAVLYLNNVEIARSTGPNHMGGGSGFPVTFTVAAPTTPGAYSYQAAWFGNSFDSNNMSAASHGEARISSNTFTVASVGTTPPADTTPPAGTTPPADATPPTINSIDPSDAQSGVGANTILTVTFSEAVVVPAGAFTLSDGAGNVPGTISVSGATATFTPSAILSDNTTYTATLSTAVTDLAGNPMAANNSSTFTTSAPSSTPALDFESSGGGGCSIASSGGGVGEIAGAYGFLLLSALGMAIRRRMKKKVK